MSRNRFVTLGSLIALLGLAACSGRPAAPAATPGPTSLPTAPVIAEWQVHFPEDIDFGFGSAWVSSHRDPNVTTRIDAASNKVVAVIQGTGSLAASVAVSDTAVWVAGQGGDLAPIDPQTNQLGPKVPGVHPRIAYGFGSVWAVGHQGQPLDRIDPATGKILTSIDLAAQVADRLEQNLLFVTRSAVWVLTNGELLRIDPASNSITLRTTLDKAVEQAASQESIPAGRGTDFLWLPVDQGLLRLDPDTGTGLNLLPLTAEQVGGGDLAVTDASVWVVGVGQIERVNVATNRVDATYAIHDKGGASIGLGFGSVWLAYEGTDLVQRLALAP